MEIHTQSAWLLLCHVIAHPAQRPMNGLFMYRMRAGPVHNWLHYTGVCPDGRHVLVQRSSTVKVVIILNLSRDVLVL